LFCSQLELEKFYLAFKICGRSFVYCVIKPTQLRIISMYRLQGTITINAILHDSTAKFSGQIDFCWASIAVAAHHKSRGVNQTISRRFGRISRPVCYDKNNAIILHKICVLYSVKKPQIFLSRFIEILATSFRNGAKMKLVFAAGTRQTRNNHLCKQTLKCPEAMILHLKSSHNSAVSVCSDSKEGLPFLIKLVQARLLYGLLLSKGTHVQSLQHSVPFCCS